jgi:hypothetical protein
MSNLRTVGRRTGADDEYVSRSLTAGGGITAGAGTVYRSSVTRESGLITTKIFIDVTGLECPTTIGDIIGVNGTALPCHIGQLKSDLCGTIVGGMMHCLEAPAGGDPDINLYAATEGTGVENDAIGDLTETLLINAGDGALNAIDYFAAVPAADAYLYLTAGTVTEATYTAGQFLITMWGYA